MKKFLSRAVGIAFCLLLLSLHNSNAQLLEYDFNGLTASEDQDLNVNVPGAFVQCPVDGYCLLAGSYSVKVSVSNDLFVSSESDRFGDYETYRWAQENAILDFQICTSEGECSAICDAECTCLQGTFDNSVFNANSSMPCTIRQELPEETIYTPEEQKYYVSSVSRPEYISVDCGDKLFSGCSSYSTDDGGYFTSQVAINGTAREFTDCSTSDCVLQCTPDCSCIDLLNEDSDTPGQACTDYVFPTSSPTQSPTVEVNSGATVGRPCLVYRLVAFLGFLVGGLGGLVG